jgi:O-antigen/teichoic acid export membrane protein
VNVMLGFNAYALQVCGRIRYLVGVNTLIAVVDVALCFLLAPRFAAVGVAVANSVALITQNLLNQWALRRSIRSAFVDRGCRTVYLVIIGVAAALWGLEALLSPGPVVALVAAAVASLLVLVVSRRALRLLDTFPELARVPFLGRLFR